MHVRKFESNSLSEALDDIKKELGPDAIILKTVTNKGLKGVFKKSPVEVTVAIPEKTYEKKAKVDFVLNKENKDKLYSNKASYISNMIDSYSDNKLSQSQVKPQESLPTSYKNLALNKSVKRIGHKIKSNLDDFLGGKTEEKVVVDTNANANAEPTISEKAQATPQPQVFSNEPKISSPREKLLIQKVDQLEREVFKLREKFETSGDRDFRGLTEVVTNLRSLDVNERTIRKIREKALFEMSEDEANSFEFVYDFALQEMAQNIQTKRPLFSTTNSKNCVTVIISEKNCGQTSFARKIASLNSESVIISEEEDDSLSKNLFQIETVCAKGIASIISATRSVESSSKMIFIDYKCSANEIDGSKKLINSLKRTFENIEVLLCVSAIHSESYNRKLFSRYESLVNGAVITNLDLCLNYGSVFNIASRFQEIPLVFYTTGETIPEDIESATSERLIGSLFKLD